MNKSLIVLLASAVILPTTISAWWIFDDPSSAQKTEVQKVSDNQKKLTTAVELPQLNTSLERINIKRRLELWNDENKMSYIYLLNYGRIVSFYTVKGKITSGTKRLTQQSVQIDGSGRVGEIGKDPYTYQDAPITVEQPELDGTYGASASYIFFWTTEGAYVQWNGEYMLSDQPLKLNMEPLLTREVK